MMIKTRTNVYQTSYHFVFVTKYRKDIFTTNKSKELMKNILGEIASEQEITIENIEIVADHVHLMVSFPPKYSISNVVRKLKGTSARRWFLAKPETKDLLWEGHLWNPSYFVSTLGNVSKEVVFDYIENQLTKYNNGRPRRDSATK